LICDFLEQVDHIEVDILRKEIPTDALRDIRIDLILIENTRFLIFLKDGTVGVDSPYFNVGIFLAKVFRSTRDCTAGSHTYDEVRNLSFGLLPNLRSGLFVVRLRIR